MRSIFVFFETSIIFLYENHIFLIHVSIYWIILGLQKNIFSVVRENNTRNIYIVVHKYSEHNSSYFIYVLWDLFLFTPSWCCFQVVFVMHRIAARDYCFNWNASTRKFNSTTFSRFILIRISIEHGLHQWTMGFIMISKLYEKR